MAIQPITDKRERSSLRCAEPLTKPFRSEKRGHLENDITWVIHRPGPRSCRKTVDQGFVSPTGLNASGLSGIHFLSLALASNERGRLALTEASNESGPKSGLVIPDCKTLLKARLFIFSHISLRIAGGLAQWPNRGECNKVGMEFEDCRKNERV